MRSATMRCSTSRKRRRSQFPGNLCRARTTTYASSDRKALGSGAGRISHIRRMQESDSWLSPNFDMHAVVEGLQVDKPLSTGPITDVPLAKEACECGVFRGGWRNEPTAEEISLQYFSNLGDDYSRLCILPPPWDQREV